MRKKPIINPESGTSGSEAKNGGELGRQGQFRAETIRFGRICQVSKVGWRMEILGSRKGISRVTICLWPAHASKDAILHYRHAFLELAKTEVKRETETQ